METRVGRQAGDADVGHPFRRRESFSYRYDFDALSTATPPSVAWTVGRRASKTQNFSTQVPGFLLTTADRTVTTLFVAGNGHYLAFV